MHVKYIGNIYKLKKKKEKICVVQSDETKIWKMFMYVMYRHTEY